jgi:predicted RNA polymerase sigma factor
MTDQIRSEQFRRRREQAAALLQPPPAEAATGNPVVTLNRAVATAMVHGPAAGLAVLEPLEEQLANHHRLDAVRAHLLEMAGDTEAAARHYRAAAARTTSLPEQHYLTTKAARLRAQA